MTDEHETFESLKKHAAYVDLVNKELMERIKANEDGIGYPKTYCQSCLRSFYQIQKEKEAKTLAKALVDGCAYGTLLLVIIIMAIIIFVSMTN